jgi:23S rRNA-/tRNA-specific pseudouridylate synthase
MGGQGTVSESHLFELHPLTGRTHQIRVHWLPLDILCWRHHLWSIRTSFLFNLKGKKYKLSAELDRNVH